MIYFLLLFILTQLALLARCIVFHAFEPMTYAATYLLLVAALFVYYFGKRCAKQEAHYIPQSIDAWSFLIKQRTFTNDKPLFFGAELRGTISQHFAKRWHYVASDIFGTSLFLSLRIVIDGHTWLITPTSHWLAPNTTWRITKDDEQMGEANTRITWKNTKRFTEMITLTIAGDAYTTSASTMTSGISVQQHATHIGASKRHHLLSHIHVIDVPRDAEAAVIATILHTYCFKQA
ncbi:MAG: hypothetical protein UHX00_01465 [Caryophanon sp.]|nr:hypothetical protein [Caryophanon sp.]